MAQRIVEVSELPPPPPGQSGWPWTVEEAAAIPGTLSNPPRISIVTPSFNQAGFLELTLRSVLLQGYPDVELLVLDGGSTDGSVEIIKKYEPWLAYWHSQKDKGQSDAVNQGFRKATGQLIGWQNSDDLYDPGCFHAAASAMRQAPDVSVHYGRLVCIDGNGTVTRENRAGPFRLEDGIPWFELGNQSLFFHCRIFEEGHFLDESYHHCMDAEFYWRLIIAGHRFRFDPGIGGRFRVHGGAKTARQQDVNAREALEVFRKILSWDGLPEPTRKVALARLRSFAATQFDHGRLAVSKDAVKLLRREGGWAAVGSGNILRRLGMYRGKAR
jgi:GT2 family glycosyltransferase